MVAIEQAPRRLRRDSIFFPAMAVAMALVVFIGFAPTYYLRSQFNGPELSLLKMVHGAAFTGWIALLIGQTGLIARGHRDLHRKLGVVGALLASLMIALGLALALDALRRGFTPPGGPPPATFFIVPLGDIFGFAILVGLGIANRKRLDWHKRYMLMGTVFLLGAGVARFRLDFVQQAALPMAFLAQDLFVAALAAYDLSTRRRIHPATLISAGVMIASQVGRMAIGGTAWWQAFAHSLL